MARALASRRLTPDDRDELIDIHGYRNYLGVEVVGDNQLLLATPANRRIDAWRLTIAPETGFAKDLAPPASPKFTKGVLTWTPSPDAVAYRVTPVLIKPGKPFPTTRVEPYAPILSRAAKLDLRRQLLPRSVYAFEISAVNSRGQVSTPIRSDEFQH